MQENIVCVICGGTDFYNEAGYYYCNECQTQTQEIREQVFDQQENTILLKTTKTTVRKEKTTVQDKLTSWEVLNYILIGLVEEMTALGANSQFKEVCFHLWTRYLMKLEVMSKTPGGIPKLSASFKKRDAEILFNRSVKKKRKRSHSADSSTNTSYELDRKLIRSEHAKQKRQLAKMEYDKFSSEQQNSKTTLHNQTLSSLGSDDETSSSTSNKLLFSKLAQKNLLKHMSKEHLQAHMNDIENKMRCHKFNLKLLGSTYKSGPCNLTRNKLYSVIYLALLLTKDEYQLSDIIRFCREGHLSYLEYKHFFPDVLSENYIDEQVYMNGFKNLFLHDYARKQTWNIYKFLELKPCDFSPDLIELCKRYCKELNLPDEIFNIAANFINVTNPEFKVNEKTITLPNYEARAMSFIIFTLKVLFSLDDETEHHFSKFAQLINETQTQRMDAKMFKFDDWYNYLQYRKIVLKNVHFPTKFLLEPDANDSVELFVQFFQQRKFVSEVEDPPTLPMKICKKYLIDLEIFQTEKNSNSVLEFKPSVTPFKSYITYLSGFKDFKVKGIKLNLEMLKDRSKESVDFLINYSPYLKLIDSENCKVKSNGVNTNHKFFRMRRKKNEIFEELVVRLENKWHNSFKEGKIEKLKFNSLKNSVLQKQLEKIGPNITDELSVKHESPKNLIKVVDTRLRNIKNNTARNSQGRFCSLTATDKKSHDEYIPKQKGKYFVSSWYDPATTIKESPAKMSVNKKYSVHYVPWLEYWINIQDINSRMTTEKWEQFQLRLPKNFLRLLEECALVLEQKTVDLFAEFVNVEVYMCYVYLNNAPVMNKLYNNSKDIGRIIKKVKSVW